MGEKKIHHTTAFVKHDVGCVLAWVHMADKGTVSPAFIDDATADKSYRMNPEVNRRIVCSCISVIQPKTSMFRKLQRKQNAFQGEEEECPLFAAFHLPKTRPVSTVKV